MPANQRFYFPTLPVIIYLTVQSIYPLLEKIPNSVLEKYKKLPKLICLYSILWISLIPSLLFVCNMLFVENHKIMVSGLNLLNYYQNDPSYHYLYRLDEFSSLPNNLVMATTEVGYPSVLNPHKLIVDLAGLNETDFAHNRSFSAELLFRKYHPDVIFMPHPHYQEMIQMISQNSYFRDHYDYLSLHDFGVKMGVALYKDSKYYQAMKKIVERTN